MHILSKHHPKIALMSATTRGPNCFLSWLVRFASSPGDGEALRCRTDICLVLSSQIA